VTTPGSWNNAGWTLVLAGMFIAAWSTYGFETAVCYTRELRNPATDAFKAIFFSGLLCIVFYFIVPFSFQGVLGLEGMLATPIVGWVGSYEAPASMAGGGPVATQLLVA
jgi:amino acid transporter